MMENHACCSSNLSHKGTGGLGQVIEGIQEGKSEAPCDLD